MSKTHEIIRIFTQRISQGIKSNSTSNHPMTIELFKFGVMLEKKPTDHSGLFGFTLHPVFYTTAHHKTQQQMTKHNKTTEIHTDINLLRKR